MQLTHQVTKGASTRQLTFGATLAAITLGAALAAIAAALAVPGLAPAATRNNTLIGTDGPGFTITMSKKTVRAGSNIHNFHLAGPGVNKLTSIPAVGTKTWTVKLKKGIYRFVCDPHATTMKGVLRVT